MVKIIVGKRGDEDYIAMWQMRGCRNLTPRLQCQLYGYVLGQVHHKIGEGTIFNVTPRVHGSHAV